MIPVTFNFEFYLPLKFFFILYISFLKDKELIEKILKKASLTQSSSNSSHTTSPAVTKVTSENEEDEEEEEIDDDEEAL